MQFLIEILSYKRRFQMSSLFYGNAEQSIQGCFKCPLLTFYVRLRSADGRHQWY